MFASALFFTSQDDDDIAKDGDRADFFFFLLDLASSRLHRGWLFLILQHPHNINSLSLNSPRKFTYKVSDKSICVLTVHTLCQNIKVGRNLTLF